MGKNMPEQAIERTSEKLLSAVFPGLGRVAESPAQGIFSAIVRTGSPQNKFGFLVRPDLRHRAHGEPSGKGHRRQLKRGGTSLKGLQEKVSGWLSRYDFARPLRDYLWREAQPLIGRDTVIAVVSGDFSKEFGGAGLEGMEMGDTSPAALHQAAQTTANTCFCRWSVEVLFQDIKQGFAVEDARVRTFTRLRNLLVLCTLAYTYFAHFLPGSGEEAYKILKTMRDTLGTIVENYR